MDLLVFNLRDSFQTSLVFMIYNATVNVTCIQLLYYSENMIMDKLLYHKKFTVFEEFFQFTLILMGNISIYKMVENVGLTK